MAGHSDFPWFDNENPNSIFGSGSGSNPTPTEDRSPLTPFYTFPAEQPCNVDPNSKPQRRKSNNVGGGAAKWKLGEDLLLVSAWLNVSKDPITGIDQDGEAFWSRVDGFCTSNCPGTWSRYPNADKNRWHRINKAVTKFNGIYHRLQAQRRSGCNESGVKELALTMYAQENNGKAFTYEPHWEVLRKEAKWAVVVCGEGSASKVPSAHSNKRPSEGDDNPIADSQTDAECDPQFATPASLEELARPSGVKAAKRRAKTTQRSRLSEEEHTTLEVYNRNKQLELEIRKLELEREAERDRLKAEELRLARKREAEAKQRENDPDRLYEILRDMSERDTSHMTGAQKIAHDAYIKRLLRKLGISEE